MRLAYVSCVRRLEEVKRSEYCTYIRPPIDTYKTLQFGSFDQILDIGYKHGKGLFSAMSMSSNKRNVSLNSFLQHERQQVLVHQGLEPTSLRPSFVDLAEKVCRVQRPIRAFSILSDGQTTDCSEDEDGLEYYYHSEPEINANETSDELLGSSAPPTSGHRFSHRKTSTAF